ncbi:neural Wiskott-Aldrich syndrome protein-like [Enhydra lutris kenyoni]|uniref:Neural Wiskott-Aldrich syndrome protein-like n=1 Tax=Enhydra lutris kenyoni TaxID=391180 RepID=A0A2Y9K881_ENHLU|nr:neural Wiskott-Aldrich syndrome protein-like [Enhydra lutris kenyoni]
MTPVPGTPVLLGSLTDTTPVALNINTWILPPSLNAAPPPHPPPLLQLLTLASRCPLPGSQRRAPQCGASKSATPQAPNGRPHLSVRRLGSHTRASSNSRPESPLGCAALHTLDRPSSPCSGTSSGPGRPPPVAGVPRPPPGPPPAPRLPF